MSTCRTYCRNFKTIEEATDYIKETGKYLLGTSEEIQDWLQKETKGYIEAVRLVEKRWWYKPREYCAEVNYRLVKKLSKRKGKLNLWKTLTTFKITRYK